MRYSEFARWASPIALSLAIGSPVMAQQLYDVKVSLTETYDSNVSRTSQALAKLRGVRQSDEIFSPQIALDLHKALGRESLFLNGTTGYDIYSYNHRLDRERVDLNGGVEAPIGPCHSRLVGSIGRHQSDLEELSSTTLTNTTNTQNLTSEGLQTSCGRLVGVTPTFAVSASQAVNSASTLRSSDHNQFSANVGLGYQRPTLGNISLFYAYNQTTYQNRLFIVGTLTFVNGLPVIQNAHIVKDQYSVNEIGVRYARELGAKLQGTVSVSHSTVHNAIPGAGDFQGLTYQAGLSFKASSRLSTNFDFSRTVKPSSNPGAAYSLAELYSLGATYQLGSRINVGLGASRTTQTFQGAGLVHAVDITHETIDRFYGRVGFRVGRRISLNLDARHDERGANIPGFSYGDTRVGLSLAASY